MGLITTAAAPWMFWIKLAIAVALLGAGAAAGNATRAHWDAGDIAEAQAATTNANSDRDAWRFAAGEWQRAISLQKAANAEARAVAARDAKLAIAAIGHAATAEQAYLRKRREIDAQSVKDKRNPKCREELERPVCGAPLL